MTNEQLTEKVSVNINSATLSGIDLLVDNGYYSNRSDFINHALRVALDGQQATIQRLIEQNTAALPLGGKWFIGFVHLSKKELEAALEAGEHFSVKGYGVLKIDPDCSDETVFAVIDEIAVRGKVSCSPAVRAHYGVK